MTTREALDTLSGIHKRALLTQADHRDARRAMNLLYGAVYFDEARKEQEAVHETKQEVLLMQALIGTRVVVPETFEVTHTLDKDGYTEYWGYIRKEEKDTAALDQARKEKGFTTHLTSTDYGRVLCGVNMYNFNVLNERTTPKESEVNCPYCRLEIENRKSL